MSEGSGETKRFEQKLGITLQGVEITIFETPKHNWGIPVCPATSIRPVIRSRFDARIEGHCILLSRG